METLNTDSASVDQNQTSVDNFSGGAGSEETRPVGTPEGVKTDEQTETPTSVEKPMGEETPQTPENTIKTLQARLDKSESATQNLLREMESQRKMIGGWGRDVGAARELVKKMSTDEARQKQTTDSKKAWDTMIQSFGSPDSFMSEVFAVDPFGTMQKLAEAIKEQVFLDPRVAEMEEQWGGVKSSYETESARRQIFDIMSEIAPSDMNNPVFRNAIFPIADTLLKNPQYRQAYETDQSAFWQEVAKHSRTFVERTGVKPTAPQKPADVATGKRPPSPAPPKSPMEKYYAEEVERLNIK